MTTHNHGRVSPFGHPRINAHQATPRGLTQPITSFIGLAYPGIHHAPKKQKNTHIFHAQTTKNTKNKTTKKKKQTTTTQLSLLFLSHSRPLYSSHTTHHPTHNTQQKALPTRGDLQNNTRAALDTQQHATKQNKPSKPEHKHTHPCFTDPPTRTTMRAGSSPPKNLCHHQAPNQTPNTATKQKQKLTLFSLERR